LFPGFHLSCTFYRNSSPVNHDPGFPSRSWIHKCTLVYYNRIHFLTEPPPISICPSQKNSVIVPFRFHYRTRSQKSSRACTDEPQNTGRFKACRFPLDCARCDWKAGKKRYKKQSGDFFVPNDGAGRSLSRRRHLSTHNIDESSAWILFTISVILLPEACCPAKPWLLLP